MRGELRRIDTTMLDKDELFEKLDKNLLKLQKSTIKNNDLRGDDLIETDASELRRIKKTPASIIVPE